MAAALGTWAGAPEAKRPYYQPIEASKPDIQAVWRLWEAIERRTKPLWETVPDGDPLQMKTGLRAACRPMLAYLQVARLDPAKARRYRDLARKGAEYLQRLQREDGLFPFPDLRGRHERFGAQIQKILRRHPAALQGGWMIDDGGDGGMQYDHGICGVAMIEMYEHGKEKKFLESARRAADWAAGRPAVTNWNYNAFSLWLLARFARASGEAKYLEAALVKLRVGVLPGQLKSGRWVDPHNARLVYHGIIVRGILELYRALPPEHAMRPEVADSLRRALDNAAGEIRRNGASSISTTTQALSRALMHMEANRAWEEALNVNVNAGLAILRDRRAPFVALYLSDYLAYRVQGAMKSPGRQ